MGAYLSSADEKDMNLLRDFGLNFGMAFQITDDLMDVVSDESTMGKPKGKDILEGHLTLPLIRYFISNQINLDGIKLSELTPDNDKFQAILDGINSDGSLSYSYDRASDFIQRALKSLDCLPKNDATAAFKQMSAELIKRKA
jgi:geranylgeranyl pyrophosphate synthase